MRNSKSQFSLRRATTLILLISGWVLFCGPVNSQPPPPIFEECGVFEPDPFGTGCTFFSAFAFPGETFLIDLGSTPPPPIGTEAIVVGFQVSCAGICFPTSCIFDASYELTCNGTPPPPEFIRGDCNNDSSFNIADAIFHLFALFASGPPPPCQNACDFNSDLSIDIGDGVAMLATLFNSGGPPAPPWPNCGADPVAPILPDCLNPICP
ncbi:MAG: hypothetical protein OSB09_11415 [Planctomycetota bacterium]|nr:hypothetical protein [Planctomycetota bacterium]